jgi:hypothetical protein
MTNQLSARAIDIAEDYACRWHPTLTLPEINKQWRHIIIEHAEAIDRETGVAELLEAFNQLQLEATLFLDSFPAMPQVEFVAGQYTWTAQQYKALIRLNNYVLKLPTAVAKCEGKGSE